MMIDLRAARSILFLPASNPRAIAKARDAGIVAATIIHPWNEEAVESDGGIGAPDWQALRAALDPVLERIDSAPA